MISKPAFKVSFVPVQRRGIRSRSAALSSAFRKLEVRPAREQCMP